jgi:hypothetical protein
MSPEVAGPPPSLTSVTSPRSMKSHVRRGALRKLQLGQLGLVAAELLDSWSTSARGSGAGSSAPASAALAARSASVERSGPWATLRAVRSMRSSWSRRSCQRMSASE